MTGTQGWHRARGPAVLLVVAAVLASCRTGAPDAQSSLAPAAVASVAPAHGGGTPAAAAPRATASSAPSPTVAASPAAATPSPSVAPTGVGATAAGAPTPAAAAAAAAPSATATAAAQGTGVDAAILFRLFPADNPWNTGVTDATVDPQSDSYLAGLVGEDLHMDFGANLAGSPFGIPYTVVSGGQPKVAVSFDYPDDSDPGPYPIPPDAAVEQGDDAHVLVLDKDNLKLYELWHAQRLADGTWHAGSGAIFDLTSNALRAAGMSSADAAGLPVLPGLVRYDEVAAGHIDHALRFTVAATQQGYVYPATHYASSKTDPSLPPMGMRVRLKASFDISGFPPQAQVILQAMKTYGMILADNGSDWFVSGTPDPRWDDAQLDTLKAVPGSAFEVLTTGPITTAAG